MRLLLLALTLWVAMPPAYAQSGKLADGPPPPPSEAATPLPAEPAWDPLHANKSIEIGMFYMKKGNYDAAIDRFQEAARLQTGLAKPYLLLGETYEKKDDPASAIGAYRKYLELYRTAPDHGKILKRIEKLEKQTQRGAKQRGSG
jgi:tetratricopeptide (TPR) repeat protein